MGKVKAFFQELAEEYGWEDMEYYFSHFPKKKKKKKVIYKKIIKK